MAKYEVNFLSCSLRRCVDVTVICPSMTFGDMEKYEKKEISYKDCKGFPVLYLLHGYGNDHTCWLNYTSIARYAEEHSLCVVMMSGENKMYHDQYMDDRFTEFMSRELPDFICNNFPVSSKPSDTYIAGLSMGGYGSMIIGLEFPKKFAAIGSFSGAFDKEFITMGTNVVDPDELLKKDVKSNKKIPNIYMTIGKEDFLLESNRRFEKLLKDNNVNVFYKEVEGYEHEWAFWDKVVLEFIEWLPRTDKYKDVRKKV